MRKIVHRVAMVGLVLAVSACACRGGHIGPYGGVHPGRCWVW